MQFSNFLFPESPSAEADSRVIDESLAEVRLCEELGYDCLWLSEHHFDGNCAYVDPVTFAAAAVAQTRRMAIGFAVAQVSLHHPVRLAEQMALLDNLSHGRLIVGLGKGTAYNVYEYQGYGIDHTEAQARYEEAEQIMLQAWQAEGPFSHQGQFWQLRIPQFRPRCYTRPHPKLIRAAASEGGTIGLARRGLPFLMNVQSQAVTAQRMALYRETMLGAGFSEQHLAACLADTWAWRNIFVAETDAEAERLALPAFAEMQAARRRLREKLYAEQGIIMDHAAKMLGAVMNEEQMRQHLIFGSPETVAEQVAALDRLGIGGIIGSFRLGDMPAEHTAHSLRLFGTRVAPRFRRPAAVLSSAAD